ncbi:MAG TPA: VWA domain-containing protein, partial [Hyphomicrobium sp.]|nr:VWA domain-containing protein [Hyphomicrobium sp.]
MPSINHSIAAAFIAAALICISAAGASAQQAPPTSMIVVDGSGSMWGNLGPEKRSKLEIVREALRNLLPNLRTDTRVGIASFGHRRRGNCGDAEVILPPDTNAPQRLAVPIDKLNAMGKGPMVLALREAANAIAGATPANIVLIADDIDNCGQDVCATLGGILATNPGLVVHTIAIGFDEAKIAHISCIARLTGGKLWNAQDSAGIVSALDQATHLAHLVPEPETPEAATAEAEADKPASNAKPGLYLSAALGAASEALDTAVRWRIRDADGDVIREARASALYEKLDPGTYQIEAQLGLAGAKQLIEVTADAAQEVRVDLNGGVLKMQARPSKVAVPLASPVFTVTPAGAEAGT